jgi:hypothetical protein
MSPIIRHRSWDFTLVLALCVIVYALGVPFFILGWSGAQPLPLIFRAESLPGYALLSALGAVSGIGLLFWKRWGLYGLGATWLGTLALNLVFPRPLNLDATFIALLLLGALVFNVRRYWRLFD